MPVYSWTWAWVEIGKTAISLSALEEHHLPALVIAPKLVAETVWTEEARIWRPDLTVEVAAGAPKKRAEVINGTADIVALGRDNILDAMDAVRAGKFKTIILDELSGFKNSKTKRFKAMKQIRKYAKHIWGLTGTPSPNGYMDLWSQIYLLDGGDRLYNSITAYRNRFFSPGRQMNNGIITEWILRPGSEGRINSLIEDLCLSMGTEGRVTLPPITHNTIKLDLPSRAKKIYKDMQTTLVADLDILGGEIHTAQNAAVLSSKLSQITSGFLYHDDADLRNGTYQDIHSDKIDTVKRIIDETGSPVIVFYRFKAELERLQKALGPIAHTVKEPDIVRKWNAGKIPVLLAHPQSAGHGLNLQHGGHTIVWATDTWSLEEYQQANKRVARNGQKHPVVIHHIVMRGTVDEAIARRLNEKVTVQQALLDYLESPL